MVRYAALRSLYEVDKTIGAGGFAKVKLATHVLTGDRVAIKIMAKELLGDDYPRVKMELEALKSISHHHICKLYHVVETSSHFFLVMEYCSGGELFDHIVEKQKLTESEARYFFRQILSAVGYLHQLGYAHRDLKPENILLDKDHNLKLIDFGLCAKPNGGMSSFLQTSCGSPTYAAPELIKGQKYLGSEVDVWSLGVLLYALLCGFLPFDATSIDKLYSKILSGKYEEPSWLSSQSKNVIRMMLQVDPKIRITVSDLLRHPWVTAGCFNPVTCQTLHKYHEKDDEVISVMADYYGVTGDEIWERVNQWNYEYDTATYQLLLARRKRGQTVSLKTTVQLRTRPRNKASIAKTYPFAEALPNVIESPMSPTRYSYNKMVESLDSANTPNGKENVQLISPLPITPLTIPARNRKRSHGIGTEDVTSPIPSKLLNTNGHRSTTETESPLNPPTTPGSKLLCSIEKKFNQVRNKLTPRRKATPKQGGGLLRVVNTKNLCNVSTTSHVNPSLVLESLKSALTEKGIDCKNTGFLLRGKLVEPSIKSNDNCKLSFELEVCMVKTSDEAEPVVGVRRKRLKGDAWCYKRVCEQILKLTNELPLSE